MRSGYGNRGALIEPQCRIRLVNRAAMAIDSAVELPLLEPVVEVGWQRQAGIDPMALEHLDHHRAHRRPRRAEADDVNRQALALGIGTEPVAAFLEPLGREQAVALFGRE